MAVVHESIDEILLALACSDGAVRCVSVSVSARVCVCKITNFHEIMVPMYYNTLTDFIVAIQS